jgi:hypothetical protein
MSDGFKFEKATLGEGVYFAPGEMGVILPCGCRKGVVKRMAPAIDKSVVNEDGEPLGAPLMKDGAFVMEEVEEIQESYCDEHTKVLVERQHEVQKALTSGATYDEAMKILTGATPFLMLGDGSDKDEN